MTPAVTDELGNWVYVEPVSKGEDLREIERLRAENERLATAMRNIKPYLEWTIGPESPGYHPTMPSAVASFLDALQDKPAT